MRGDTAQREQLTNLVEESQRLGLISETDSEPLTRSLTEPETPARELQVLAADIASVDADADADTEEILRMAADFDRTRHLVRDHGTVVGSVHARDAMFAGARGRPADARSLARPVPELAEDAPVAAAIDLLRRRRATCAVVRGAVGSAHRHGHAGRPGGRFPQPQAA